MQRLLRGGSSMVGVAVSMIIVVCAVMFFVMGGFGLLGGEKKVRPDGKGETLVGRVRYTAEDSKCKTQLSQIRQLISISEDPVENTYPASLKEVGGLPMGYDKCPIGKEQYTYDPATGEVECPHAGHEDY